MGYLIAILLLIIIWRPRNKKRGVMSCTAGEMKGLKFKLGRLRFCVNTRGIDISNGMKGSFLFHPFTRNFSPKQYRSTYKWLFTDDIKTGASNE